MNHQELDILLMRLRDGDKSPATLEQARLLLSSDDRFPEDLRQCALDDDPADASVALLCLLGHEDGLGDAIMSAVLDEVGEDGGRSAIHWESNVADEHVVIPANDTLSPVTEEMLAELESYPVQNAISWESGPCNVVDGVMEILGILITPAVAPAVQGAAGTVDVAHRVLGRLGLEYVSAKDAVSYESGETPELWGNVASGIGESASLQKPLQASLSAALAAEAGQVDIVEAVMARVLRSAVAPVVDPIPAPANRQWFKWASIAVAAVALIGISLPFFTNSPPDGGSETVGFQFASAVEIVVDDLNYDEDAFVQVIQDTDDQGGQALIIWVDDEAVL